MFSQHSSNHKSENIKIFTLCTIFYTDKKAKGEKREKAVRMESQRKYFLLKKKGDEVADGCKETSVLSRNKLRLFGFSAHIAEARERDYQGRNGIANFSFFSGLGVCDV